MRRRNVKKGRLKCLLVSTPNAISYALSNQTPRNFVRWLGKPCDYAEQKENPEIALEISEYRRNHHDGAGFTKVEKSCFFPLTCMVKLRRQEMLLF